MGGTATAVSPHRWLTEHEDEPLYGLEVVDPREPDPLNTARWDYTGVDESGMSAEWCQVLPGDLIKGKVMRLPVSGRQHGNYLDLLQLETSPGRAGGSGPGALLRIPATKRKGHSVLGHELKRKRVLPGDTITIRLRGVKTFKPPGGGEVWYRDYQVIRHG